MGITVAQTAMSSRNKWLIAAGILALAAIALALGVPAQYVLFGAIVLACPAMMLFMHGGHDQDRKNPPE